MIDMLFAEINSSNHQIKSVYWFSFICILYVAFALVGNYVLISEEMYFDFLGEKLAYERIVDIVETEKKWRWLGYTIIPIFLLLKCFLVVCCLSVGVFLTSAAVSFKDIFRIVIIAELVFTIPPLVKIIWFSIFFTGYTLQDLQHFSPFSMLNFIEQERVEAWYLYPLQLLNIFELVYWYALAYQLKEILNRHLAGSLGFVASTYGVGLLLWVIFVMFLTVSLT
ncbi:MAG: hypothetical protein U5K54_28060 [Cytophagales bacterium]|nr:hypothetical protein [Cytophagales bacterium]